VQSVKQAEGDAVMRPHGFAIQQCFAAALVAIAVTLASDFAVALDPSTREARVETLAAITARLRTNFYSQDVLNRVDIEALSTARRDDLVNAPTDAEFAAGINALLGELKVSHTGFLTPDDVDYYVLADVFRNSRPMAPLLEQAFGAGVRPWFAGVGLFTARIDGRHHADLVLDGSPADKAGLRVGDEIVSVNDGPYTQIAAFRGRLGETVKLGVRRTADGEVQVIPVEVIKIVPEQAFREAMLSSARVIEAGAHRIGYVHVWAVRGDETVSGFGEALGRLRRADGGQHGRQPPLTHLIIDLRGKIGGDPTAVRGILDRLAPRGPHVTSKGQGASAYRPPRTFKGHTTVLIDHHTRSAGEILAYALKAQGIGTLIGTRTATAVTAGAAFPLPGRNILYVAIQALEVDGVDLEGRGVEPDILVDRPRPYAKGADPVLDAAVNHVMKGVGGGE
jgi:carboxyl-terminal processing protease